jgi:hypothetical protein
MWGAKSTLKESHFIKKFRKIKLIEEIIGYRERATLEQ